MDMQLKGLRVLVTGGTNLVVDGALTKGVQL